jgi:hypothetical protein
MYARILARRGLSLGDFSPWCAALALIEPHLNGPPLPRRWLREHLRNRLPMVSFDLIEDRMSKHGLQWDRMPEMRSLLTTLKALDLQYHDIGNAGLYWQMRAQGICNSSILRNEDVTAALNTPPQGTRAQPRAKAICEVWRDASARAHWMAVTSARGTMELPDPFAGSGQWVAPPKTEAKKTA